MKVLFISSWYPNKVEGLNGNFVQRYAEAVSTKCKVEVLHVVGDPDQKDKFILDDQKINGIRTLIIYYRNTNNSYFNFIRRMKAYYKGFSMMNFPDLIHANIHHKSMLVAYFLKKRLRIPYVISEHWSGIRSPYHKKLSFLDKIIIRKIGNNASYILPVTSDLKRGLRKLGIKTDQIVIPNVVDTQLFTPSIEEFHIPKFIHISSLAPLKNADLIANTAVKLLDKGYDFKLQIGGDGTLESLQKLKQIVGLRKGIEVFSSQTLEEVSTRMKQSTCFILFSNTENQPCVIAEAFSSGLDVIAPNVGGISEYFPESFGVLIDKVDVLVLERAMLEIITKNNLSLKQEKHLYAQKKFSKETIAQKIYYIYKKTLN